MKLIYLKTQIIYYLFAISIIGLLILLPVPCQSQHYEAYYNFLCNYPDEEETGYHENVQGITHGDKHWYITQTEASNDESIMWKIPVECNLNSPSGCSLAISKFYLDNVQELHDLGYDHFGDPDCRKYNNEYYVFIPIERGPIPAIMVVRCSDLVYMGYSVLNRQSHAAWCAIDKKNDILYSSDENVTFFYRYQINWQTLFTNKTGFLKNLNDFNIKDETNSMLTLNKMQGGAISEYDNLIYVVSGFYDNHYENDGINVFDMKTGKRVQRSTNGSGYFNYEFHPGILEAKYEEPEGITVWDLDGSNDYNISGQLHVLMLDNDLDADDVYIKHYTNIIYVNGSYSGDERGRPWDPFNTVSEAVNFAWDGSKIKIQAGTYSESVTFIKKIQILAKDGSAVVGKSGQLKLTTSGMINMTGGQTFFKIY